MIKIFHPPSYINERHYIYNVVFNHWLGIEYSTFTHHLPTTIITADGSSEGKEVILEDGLFATPQDQWLSENSLPKSPLHYFDLSSMPFREAIHNLKVPILYGKNKGYIHFNEDKVNIGIDILGSIFFMISRYEEIVKKAHDVHERFYSTASLAYEENFLERPLGNEYLEILWHCLKILNPTLKRRKRSYKLFLTHDVDHPFSLEDKSLSRMMRTSMADLIKRKDISLFYKRIQFLLMSKNNGHAYDPNNTFDFIMDISEKNNLKSSFYFIAGHTAGPIDGFYDMDMPVIRRLMRNIYERGHEIGLHPSYHTFLSRDNLKKEFENLLRACKLENIKQDKWGGRQHYLRWQAPITWQNWEDVGLSYDSTLNFADHIGFRCGVCYDFPVFNLLTSKQLKLIEIPLIVMEGSLLGEQYQRQGLKEAYDSIVNLFEKIRFFNGTFTLLWHNNMLISSGQKEVYKKIIQAIA